MRKNFMIIELMSSDMAVSISYYWSVGITIFDVKYLDPLTVRLSISRPDFYRMIKAVNKKGDRIRVVSGNKYERYLCRIQKRTVLMLSICFLICMTIWIPRRVLFIAICGNERTDSKRLLRDAEECGLYFGADRSKIRSEKIKNFLLEKNPALAWVGINTVGCRAIIYVKEKQTIEEIKAESNYSNIVATKNGIVTSFTTLSGNSMCSIGDAVKEGQVLISGYQDMGILVKLTRSKGEIYAKTENNIRVIAPKLYTKGIGIQYATRKSLVIGKKRINLSKYSGISYAGCDKIYLENYMILPGGYVLPVSVVTEHIYTKKRELIVADNDLHQIVDRADTYLLEHMISGRIMHRHVQTAQEDTVSRFEIHYACIEMIGAEQAKEYRFDYGKDD